VDAKASEEETSVFEDRQGYLELPSGQSLQQSDPPLLLSTPRTVPTGPRALYRQLQRLEEL